MTRAEILAALVGAPEHVRHWVVCELRLAERRNRLLAEQWPERGADYRTVADCLDLIGDLLMALDER